MEQTPVTQIVAVPRWLNQKQAAEYAGGSLNTFKRHLVATGKVKTYLTDFGPRYDREQIDRAIKEWV